MTTHDLTPVTPEDWIAATDQAAARAATRDPDEDARRVAVEAEYELRRRLEAWPRYVPKRFADAQVEDLTGDLAAIADEWDGQSNVLLLGGVGVGKTHAAVAMARMIYETEPVLVEFRPAVELLDDLRPGGPERTMESACDVGVLILDDLGRERPTDWTGERLYRLVNRRWLEERPTLVTSNLSAEDLEQAVGPAMWSRLWHGALAMELAGEDRRRAA